tara:strand:- start:22 stop:429 length:408 start_codon:yes stop_codon:yes gene_type:complete
MKNENEKDCTDQLIECTVQCDTNDPECEAECVEEYHECDISQEFTPEDVEQCITDGTDYKDCVDHMVATMPNNNWKQVTTEEDKFMDMDRGELISELLQITALLGGEMTRESTLNSTGRQSKRIVIEYDVSQKNN